MFEGLTQQNVIQAKLSPCQCIFPATFSLSLCNLQGNKSGLSLASQLCAQHYRFFWLYEFSKSLCILAPMSSSSLSLGHWFSIRSGQITHVPQKSFQGDCAGKLLHTGVVPAHGVTMDNYIPAKSEFAPSTFKVPVPKFIYL